MGVDDSIGVVSFGDSGDEEYPGTGAPQQIVDQSTRDAATAAVDGIGFGGCTFMGAGIQEAGGMLAGAGTRRAMVLLSDGYDNKGCDEGNPAKPWAVDAAAALPADLPIYSCAMGPASDQTLLAQLADDTDGRYYFMPTIDDLFEIYNYIRGQVTGDGVIVNESSIASVSQVSGWVDGCAESVLFTVAWHDTSLRYVPRDPKGAGEIAVRLRSPGGRWLPRSATEFVRNAGDGYVSFTIQDPQPGLWTVEVATDRQQHTPYTVGGFVRSPLTLQLDVPTLVRVGDVIGVKTSVGDRRGGIDGVKVRATVAAPVASSADLIDKYRRQALAHQAATGLPRRWQARQGPRPRSLSSCCCGTGWWRTRVTTSSRRGSTTSRSARRRSSPRVWLGSARRGPGLRAGSRARRSSAAVGCRGSLWAGAAPGAPPAPWSAAERAARPS